MATKWHNDDCITMEQMKEWHDEDNKEMLKEATRKANACPLCKRIWMKFYAELRTSA